MSHMPVNHHLRPVYRAFAALVGLYVLVFGIVGLVQTRGTELFGRGSVHALGLRTNLAFAILSVVVGAVVLLGLLIGRNVDRTLNLYGGLVFLVVGILMLTVMQTDANLLNFTVGTCVVSFVIGLVLYSAGLYGRVGSDVEAQIEERFRHGGHDPVNHPWHREQERPHRPADESNPELHRFG